MKTTPQPQHPQAQSIKIKLLKQSVYPKKRRSPMRSNSLKIILPKKIFPNFSIKDRMKVISSQVFEHGQQDNQGNLGMSHQNQEEQEEEEGEFVGGASLGLKRTNLEFNTHRERASGEVSPWTTLSWMPKASGALMKINNRQKHKQDNRLEDNLNRIICQSPPSAVPKKYEPKDAQSLLRKNSLFLLNFIKSKQKRNSKIAHVGNIPLILQKIQRNKIPHDPAKTNRQQRQKKFLQALKSQRLKQQTYFQKRRDYPPILSPEPW